MPEINLAVLAPDQTALNASAQSMLDGARAIVIDGDGMYQVAADELAAIKGKAKSLEEQRTKLVGPLNQVVKDINAMFKPPIEFLTQAEGILKRAMLGYQDAQERKRKDEEARARAAAEAEAARERARIEQERAAAAEKARLEQDRLEQERRAALAAGDTVKAAKIEAKAEGAQEAAEARLSGLDESAALVQAAPVALAAQEAPKVSGVSTRTQWVAEVHDFAAMLAHVATNPQFHNLVKVDEKALNQLARALKQNLAIPGVTVREERLLASRAA